MSTQLLGPGGWCLAQVELLLFTDDVRESNRCLLVKVKKKKNEKRKFMCHLNKAFSLE